MAHFRAILVADAGGGIPMAPGGIFHVCRVSIAASHSMSRTPSYATNLTHSHILRILHHIGIGAYPSSATIRSRDFLYGVAVGANQIGDLLCIFGGAAFPRGARARPQNTHLAALIYSGRWRNSRVYHIGRLKRRNYISHTRQWGDPPLVDLSGPFLPHGRVAD